MNMLHLHSPWETETGSAGEQPVKGYHGQAHQTMRGRGVQLASRPTSKPHRMIDLLCLKKRKNFHVNLCPGNRARHTGRCLAPTAKAFIALRPTDAKNVTPAGCLIAKPQIELLEIPGVIDACRRSRKGFHAQRYYMQGALASNG